MLFKSILKRINDRPKSYLFLFPSVIVLSLFLSTIFVLEEKSQVLLIQMYSSTVKVNTKFLSLGLDSSVIANGFRGFDMTNPRLLRMMQALAPGYLRIGGTLADRLHFTLNGSTVFKFDVPPDLADGKECYYDQLMCRHYLRPNFTMSGQEWLDLNRLASAAGLTILFDLNVLVRLEDGSWNSSNAVELIKFSDQHGLDIIWQLGNEPNSFHHVFNYSVNASQLSKDFRLLRTILSKYSRCAHAY